MMTGFRESKFDSTLFGAREQNQREVTRQWFGRSQGSETASPGDDFDAHTRNRAQKTVLDWADRLGKAAAQTRTCKCILSFIQNQSVQFARQ
jgi:hypothetical protein